MTWLAIKLFLGGMWKRLVDAVTRYPWQAALLAVLLWGLYERNQADKWHKAHDVLKVAVKAQKKASEANPAAAKAQNAKWEAEGRQAAKDVDYARNQARAAERSLIAAHADSLRLDKVCRRAATAPGEAPTPAPADRPDLLSGMVAVPREEYEGLAENTKRLDWIVSVWVPDLQARGLVVPDPAFGQQ